MPPGAEQQREGQVRANPGALVSADLTWGPHQGPPLLSGHGGERSQPDVLWEALQTLSSPW